MSRSFFAGLFGSSLVLAVPSLLAGPIVVPNGSFELPATEFVSTLVDSWQKALKPDWYIEAGFFWPQLVGLFKNTPSNSPDHIDNCDGNRAIWLFAVPEVAIYQDYDTLDADDAEPSHAF